MLVHQGSVEVVVTSDVSWLLGLWSMAQERMIPVGVGQSYQRSPYSRQITDSHYHCHDSVGT